MGLTCGRSVMWAMVFAAASTQAAAQSSDVRIEFRTHQNKPVNAGGYLEVRVQAPAGLYATGYIDPVGLGANGFRMHLSPWTYDCPSGRVCLTAAITTDLRLPPGPHNLPVTLWDGAGREHHFSGTFRSEPAPDADNDGLPDQWEAANDLDPARASGEDGAEGDPDGDGDVNLKEYLLDTFPRGRYRHYFSEASAGARQGAWACVELFQPELKPTAYRVRFVGDDGRAAWQVGKTGPTTQVACGLPLYSFLADRIVSVSVESSEPLVVDRYFQRAADSAARTQTGSSLPNASAEWHFADAVSAGAFDSFLLTYNPHEAPVEAEFVYYRRSGEAPIRQTRVLPPRVRTTVWVSQDVAEASGKDLALTIRAGAPILVERAWRRDPPGRTVFHDLVSAGAAAPASSWLFPHVALSTRGSADWATSFVIANPADDRTAIVDATLYGAGGPPSTMRFEVGALSRETLSFERLHQLRAVTGTVSMELRSVNGVPIVAERTVESLRPEGEWRESAIGVTEAGARWAVPEAWAWLDSSLSIVNPSDVDATVRVKSYFLYGTYDSLGEETMTLTVPARRMQTVRFSDVVGPDRPFLRAPGSLVITSVADGQGRVAPIVVERAARPRVDGSESRLATVMATPVR